MKSFYLLLILIILSEITSQKWLLKTKFEKTDEINSYNSVKLTLGEYTKGILYCECNLNELNNLINEINNYLTSSTTTEFLSSTYEILIDALNYAKKILIKEPCNQSEIDQVKTNINNAYQNLINSKGKTFDLPTVSNEIYDTNRGFIHPGGLYTQEDFDRVKKKLQEEDPDIVKAYEVLKKAEYAQPNAKTLPSEKIIRGCSGCENYINAARGASIAFQNALRWKIEGNEDCAKHAIEVLMAWARTTKVVTGDSNYALATGLYGYEFAQAAEIMSDCEFWEKDDFELFKQWMLNVWYPFCMRFLRERNGTWENKSRWWEAPGHYWSNWGLCNVLAVISIGILCDDVFIYNQGMSFFKYDQVGTYVDPRSRDLIQNNGLTEFLGNLVVTTSQSDLEKGAYGKLGQMNESGRDIGHACMALGLAVDIAHQGWQQGDDLFSYMDHRLAAGIEYVAAQTQLIENLPWTIYQYGTNGFYYTDYRAYNMTKPCLEHYIRPYWGIVIGIYEEIKGIEMPFANMSYHDMGIDGGASGPTSGYYDHMGYSFLLNKRDGLAPENKVPTELKGIIKYSGDLDNLIPSLNLEKSMGNIKEDIIYHFELGGLINHYKTNNNVCVPKYSTITLIPVLPTDEENTGNWKWDTGETTQNITIEVDKSYAYRVTYTNKNGIESKQLFTIAVQGDCRETKATQSIYLGDNLIGNDTAEVNSGSTITLELNTLDSYGTFLWSTGETDYKINIPYVNDTRNITVIFTNMCGRKFTYLYQLFVKINSEEDISSIPFEITDFKIQRKINNNKWEDSLDYVINNNGTLIIDTQQERQKYFYLGVTCNYSPPDNNLDYIKLVPINFNYFQEFEIKVKLIRDKNKYLLNLSSDSFTVNSFAVFSLTNIIYNVDKIKVNFLAKDKDGNTINYIAFEDFDIEKFKTEEEFSQIQKNITTTYKYDKNITIEISNDNQCFEPEVNLFEISLIGIEELVEISSTQELIDKYDSSNLYEKIKSEEVNSQFESSEYDTMIKEEYSSYYKEDNSKREENTNHIDNNISSMEEQTYKEESITSQENENELEEEKMEEQIIYKVNELKENIENNFVNNALYENKLYNIHFYNTSIPSQNEAILDESKSNVNLMNCEKKLKGIYNIPESQVLNIIKVDIKRKETNSLQVEYEVFSEDFRLLDLNHCKDEKVRVTIPHPLNNNKNIRKLSKDINIEEKYKLGLKYGYDIFNPNSSFYNDICTVFDSEYSTDLILEDRKKYYYTPQLFCEEGCTYVSYNITNNKVTCDCYTKIQPKYNSLLRNFTYNKLNEEFNKTYNNVNFRVFKCLNKSFENFTKNIGVWIILILFLLFCFISILTILSKIKSKKLNVQNILEEENTSSFSETNLSLMPYEHALRKEKRNYLEIYIGMIKYNNIIVSIFYTKNNNRYLKILLLIFFVVILFLFNLFLFFDKDFTHIYLKEDKYDFGNEYPMSLVTAFICLLINMQLRILLNEENKKQNKFKRIPYRLTNARINKNENEMKIESNNSEIKINFKLIIFELITFILIIFVFFYIISFGGIFVNNQKYIVIRVVLSFVTSFILSFILCLIYSFLRYFGLKKQIECLFNISKIVQNY